MLQTTILTMLMTMTAVTVMQQTPIMLQTTITMTNVMVNATTAKHPEKIHLTSGQETAMQFVIVANNVHL